MLTEQQDYEIHELRIMKFPPGSLQLKKEFHMCNLTGLQYIEILQAFSIPEWVSPVHG